MLISIFKVCNFKVCGYVTKNIIPVKETITEFKTHTIKLALKIF